MNWIDFSVIAVYFVFLLIITWYLSRKNKNTSDFFVSGRNTHWLLAGISMVATTFAADTPLAVTGIVAASGVSGNWIWWNFALSGMMTVFFFSHLWKRSGVTTDLEFIDLRYSGKSARFLRIFRSIYLSVGVNSIILGWVTIGMGKILSVTLDWPVWLTIGGLYLITALYIVFTGLRGVIIADMIQFLIALISAIGLSVVAINYLGGLEAFQLKISTASVSSKMQFFPWENSLDNWIIWISMMWWASWYPGSEPGGGGYIAQRMFSVKTEKDSVYATILFNVLHFAVRPWPWIIVAFVSFIMMPGLSDPEKGYPLVMMKLLKAPYLGIMMTGFIAAFMSTLSTHLNWASSYLVHDVYRANIKKEKSEAHYLYISRMMIFLLMALSFTVSYFFDTVKGAWEFLLALGAGTGPVYLLRWYWWRINAFSEIAAMVSALFITVYFQIFPPASLGIQLIVTTAGTTFFWLTVTFLTPPVEKEKLNKFFEKVQPGHFGYKGFYNSIGKDMNQSYNHSSLKKNTLLDSFFLWILSVSLIYSILFGIGSYLFGKSMNALCYSMIILFLIPVFILRLRKFTRNLN